MLLIDNLFTEKKKLIQSKSLKKNIINVSRCISQKNKQISYSAIRPSW